MELHQLDTFYNALTPTNQDSLNVAAGVNLLTKTPRDALTIIENKSKVGNSQNKPIVTKLSTNAPSSSTPHSPKIAALVDTVKAMLAQKYSPPASVKAVEEICVTCGGPHPYHQCLATDGNVFPEYQDNIQGYVSAAVVNYNQGNTRYRPRSVANQIRSLGFAQPNVQNNQTRYNQDYDGILSYENEVLQSVFLNKESELEKQPLYDRFVTAGGMHAVPPPMTGNFMTSATWGMFQIKPRKGKFNPLKAQIKKLKKQAKPVITHHRAWMKDVSLKQKIGRDRSLREKNRCKKNTLDYIETADAQDVGRIRDVVDEEKENVEDVLSTEDVLLVLTRRKQIEGTDEQIESTDEQRKGTEDHTEEGSATQATQTPTSTIFGDDETIAKVLLNMSQAKAVSREKEKGVELKDIEETDRPRPTSTRSLLTLKPLPKIDPKDKGKKKIEEEDESESESDGIPEAEKKFKQLESDEEMARKIQEEWEGEEERNRIAEEKATNEALIRNYDDIKARIEADRLLAEKLQEEEREQFTIEERAKFLHDTIAAQRKFLAQQRSEAIRNRPPTKNQLRNQMMTYLKHVGNFKHSELKTKKFEEIQALYEKIKRSDEDFISIGSAEDERLIKRMNEKGIDSSKNEMVKEESKEEVKEENKEEESTRKRKLGTRKKMKSRKRRFIQNTSEDDSEKENDELRLHLTIAPDEEKEVDYEILDRKYPIKEWKT
ncbi:hypothetical protein Tco_1138293 [Tanacetum coccineum]